MFTIRKLFKFEAAHRLETSYSKCCQHIHGHSYRVEVFFRSSSLNADGMVVDFGEIKKVLGAKIESWDHSLMLRTPGPQEDDTTHHAQALTDKCVFVPFNPTAEKMAEYLFHYAVQYFPGKVLKVRVHETVTGWAEYEEVFDETV